MVLLGELEQLEQQDVMVQMDEMEGLVPLVLLEERVPQVVAACNTLVLLYHCQDHEMQ